MSINAVEAFALDEFSIEAVRANLAESQKIANGNGSEADIAEAKIEVEVSIGPPAGIHRPNWHLPVELTC